MQILIEPENQWATIDKATTVLNLLKELELRPNQALVIRDGELLTPDRKVGPQENITVRKIASRG